MTASAASPETVVSVDGVWKRFTRHRSGTPTLKQMLLNPRAQYRRDRFWALRDISLVVGEGDTVGIIGANGSGKSTLLRLVGGLGKPTRGRIVRQRAVGAMMTLGESFDPLLTGRENAITGGIIAGYTRKQALAKLDEIVEFAELDDSFDLPIRVYSDGMRMRLGFSVAISAEPEILLIDEVLSVGDLRFQEKCFDRLSELQARGTTILLASHDEDQVMRLCGRVVWLAQGRIQAQGSPEEVYEEYRQAMRLETQRRTSAEPPIPRHAGSELSMEENRFGTLEVEIADVRITPSEVPRAGNGAASPVTVEIDIEPRAPVDEPIVAASLHRVTDGAMVLDVSTEGDGVGVGRLDKPTTIALVFDRLDFEPGAYKLSVGVYERSWAYVYDYHWQAYPLEVTGRGGGFGPPRRWLAGNP